MIREPALPARWAFLLDAEGRFDCHRLSPFRLSAGIDIYAICGGSGGPNTAFVVAATDCDAFVLVADTPIRQVYGPTLSDATLAAIAAFMERNRSALHAHWNGELDSIELADRLVYGL